MTVEPFDALPVVIATPHLPDPIAARPGGAQSAIRTPLAARIFRIALTTVVLPTPGPPVTTSTSLASAAATAARWLSASTMPARCSTHGMALAGSIAGQGEGAAAIAARRSAMPRSARWSPARKITRRSSTSAATTAPSPSSRASVVSTGAAGASSSVSASGTGASSGRPQWPSSIASASACESPARIRISAVFSIPSRIAIWSAVLKPMPRMSRASR
jgi:hypothetical protein